MRPTLEEKAQFVRAWESSGKTQDACCDTHPWKVAPRKLRAWARMLKRPGDHVEHARGVVAEAVEQLVVLLKFIEAVAPRSARGARASAAGTCRVAATPSADAPTAPVSKPEPPPTARPSPPPSAAMNVSVQNGARVGSVNQRRARRVYDEFT